MSKMTHSNAPILRQVLVFTGLLICNISDGFIFGQLSGMVDAFFSKDSSISLDEGDVSWIASTLNVTCFCGFLITTVLTEIFGRRKTITFTTIPLIISWIMVYLAQDKFTILFSRVIVGTCYGGVILLCYINIGEYVPPNIRPIISNLVITIGSSIGTTLGHILSLYLNWRNVALIGLIPSVISAILPLFWVESPSWLASKGRFEECERAFKLLHIENPDSEKEIQMLIHFERTHQKDLKKMNSIKNLVKKFLEATKHRYFWKISFLIHVIGIYRVAAGRILFNTYAITIIQDITGSSDILLFTFLIDGFAILGGGISCILVNKFKLRHLLFSSGIIANIILIVTAATLYSWNIDSPYFSWLKVTLLAVYFIIVNAGPYAVLETVLSEVHPLDIKAINILHVGCVAGVIQFLGIKLASNMFLTIGYHGVFILNAIIVFMCLLYLYVYLPETKGRTLQEIESYFKYNTFQVNTDLQIFEKENMGVLKKLTISSESSTME